jgi:hypothetical protein
LKSDLDLLSVGSKAHIPHEADLYDLREPFPLFIGGSIKSGNIAQGVGHPFETPLAREDQLHGSPTGAGTKRSDQEINVPILNIPYPVHELDLGPEVVRVASRTCIAVRKEPYTLSPVGL